MLIIFALPDALRSDCEPRGAARRCLRRHEADSRAALPPRHYAAMASAGAAAMLR